MTTRSIGFLLFILVLLTGCSTASLNEAKPLRIRKGVTPQEAKYAIVSALLPDRKPAVWPADQALTDEALRTLYAQKFQKPTGPAWSLEEISGDVLILNYERGRHSLRMEYAIGQTQITPRILSSRNLEQTEKTIHENVFDWLESFADVVDDNMEHLQDRKG